MTVWRLRDPSSLHVRPWDDGMIVYHAPSGDTHLLEPAVAAALLCLRGGPRDLQGIVRDAGAAGPEFEAALRQLLAELEELGVAEHA